MSVIQWPNPMPVNGRLSLGKTAYGLGKGKVSDSSGGCPQTLHVNLFFDGTNNNDADFNPNRDRASFSQTNVARLFDAAKDSPDEGIFKFYMPGVGTMFPQIAEKTYSSDGKAFASGYGPRVAWGYTRVLNAIYGTIHGNSRIGLISDDDAQKACLAMNQALFQSLEDAALKNALDRLRVAHRQAGAECRVHRTIRKVWINVFGFSRGAAEARTFVSRLLNVWAKDGKIAGEIEYGVNFLGLFDTVASVGPPDSTRTAIPFPQITGHFGWASGALLDIPEGVRRCVHFVSIHEQRMSFPLDSIRMGKAYPGSVDRLLEVAYPGVHSDVGGGYAPGEQGKAFTGEGTKAHASDSAKLSQIPLHDMYIEALKAGVPLTLEDDMTDIARSDFALSPSLIQTFNDWLKTTPSISTLEQAMQFGMAQMLSWRTLRAAVGTDTYVTKQPFYDRAHEGAKSRQQIRVDTDKLNASDPQIAKLNAQRKELAAGVTITSMSHMDDPLAGISQRRIDIQKEYDANSAKLSQNDDDLARARERNAVKAAGPGSPPMKPGNGADDLVSTDRTDLLEAAEEFQLLLTWLHPSQAATWRAQIDPTNGLPFMERQSGVKGRAPDTHHFWMKNADWVSAIGAVLPFTQFNDVVIAPGAYMKGFLARNTSMTAVTALQKQKAAVTLYDDYVHDSRAWFRVPYFRENAPGGFFWARMIFVGGNTRVSNLGLPDSSQEEAAAAYVHELNTRKFLATDDFPMAD